MTTTPTPAHVIAPCAASAYWLAPIGPSGSRALMSAPIETAGTIAWHLQYDVDREDCFGGPFAFDALCRLCAYLELATESDSQDLSEPGNVLGVQLGAEDTRPIAARVDIDRQSGLVLLLSMAKLYTGTPLAMVADESFDDGPPINGHVAMMRLKAGAAALPYMIALRADGTWHAIAELRG